jgi:hypothetical protein
VGKTTALAVAILSWAGASLAAAASPSAEDILDLVRQRGAQAATQDLYAEDSTWRAVLQGVSSARPEWLEVAVRLQAGARPPASLDLSVAVAAALEQAPASVLAAVQRSRSEERSGTNAFHVGLVCGNFQQWASSPGQARGWLDRQQKAVSGVSDPSLSGLRRECLQQIAAARRLAEEYFSSAK